jgi:hypothetical protein
MSLLPLYEELADGDCVRIDHSLLSSIINQLPPEHGEIIYAMILHHYITYENGKDTKRKPYGIKSLGKKGVIVTIDKLPEKLILVITRYLEWIGLLTNIT